MLSTLFGLFSSNTSAPSPLINIIKLFFNKHEANHKVLIEESVNDIIVKRFSSGYNQIDAAHSLPDEHIVNYTFATLIATLKKAKINFKKRYIEASFLQITIPKRTCSNEVINDLEQQLQAAELIKIPPPSLPSPYKLDAPMQPDLFTRAEEICNKSGEKKVRIEEHVFFSIQNKLYQIKERITKKNSKGAGRKGTSLHLATDALGNLYVIKREHSDFLHHSEFATSYLQEKLGILHGRMVRIHQVKKDVKIYYVMPYLSNNLYSLFVKEQGDEAIDLPRTNRELIAIFLACTEAVWNLHASRYLHLDLKVENFTFILSQNTLTIFIIDFEALKKLNKGESRTLLTTIPITTSDFRAPEVTQFSAVSTRSDIYSLGCFFDISLASRGKDEPILAFNFVDKMLQIDSTTRITLPEVLQALLTLAKTVDLLPDEEIERLKLKLQTHNNPQSLKKPGEKFSATLHTKAPLLFSNVLKEKYIPQQENNQTILSSSEITADSGKGLMLGQ